MRKFLFTGFLVLSMSLILVGCGKKAEVVSTSENVEASAVDQNASEEVEMAETIKSDNVNNENNDKNDKVEKLKDTESEALDDKDEQLSNEEIEKSIVEIIDGLNMLQYAFADSLFFDLKDVGSKREIELNEKEMLRISGYNAYVKTGHEIEIDEYWEYAIPIDKEDTQQVCFDVFGKDLNCSILDDTPNEKEGPMWLDSNLVRVEYWGETDTDLIHKNTILKNLEGNIQASEEVYCGYWGVENKKSNFRFNYTFEKNDKSKYGIVITKISLERIRDEHADVADARENEEDKFVLNEEGFYGIFISAFKDEVDADNSRREARMNGFDDATVILTSDWSNLNPEPYYVVTTGMYYSKELASDVLRKVKDAGYTSAYIKESGKYIGSQEPSKDHKYSDDDLCKMAMDYYKSQNGYAPSAMIDGSDGNQVTIHLFEDHPDHIATLDWYYVDPNTATGTNFMGEPIDLKQ